MEAPASRLLLLLLLGAWASAPGSASSEAPPLVNEDVKRTVDLSSHLAKVTAEVVLAHAGGGSTSRATSFLLALEPELEARLAHLGVQVSAGSLPPPQAELRAWSPTAPPRRCGASGRGWDSVPGPRRLRRRDTSAQGRPAPARGLRPGDPLPAPHPRRDLRARGDVASAAWYRDHHVSPRPEAGPASMSGGEFPSFSVWSIVSAFS